MLVFQPVIPGVLGFVIIGVLFLGTGIVMGFHWKNRYLRKRWLLRLVTVGLLSLLLLRPGVSGITETETFTNNYDVFFVVDTTASMVAEDWETGTETTRLDAVKSDIVRLVDEYPDARYSLINVTSNAKTVAPLTKDSSAIVSSVNFLSPEITRFSNGSNFDTAATELTKTLKENQIVSPDRTSIVFLFTDGEITNPTPEETDVMTGVETKTSADGSKFVDAAEYLVSGGVLGYGTSKGGKMKTQNGYFISNEEEYIKDPTTGQDAVSVIDEKHLNQYAEWLGVEYAHREPGVDYEAPGVDNVLAVNDKSKRLNVTDYSWVVALLLLGFVTFETGRTFRQMRLTKGGERR